MARKYTKLPKELRPFVPELVEMVRRLDPKANTYKELAEAFGCHWRRLQDINLAERESREESAPGPDPVGGGGSPAAGDLPLPFEGGDHTPPGPGDDDRGAA